MEASSDGFVYAVGSYSMSIKGEHTTDRGKFLEVWHRNAAGEWKCVADSYSSDLPLSKP